MRDLRAALHQAQAAFLAVLDGYSLADLVQNREMLHELLDRGPQAVIEPAVSTTIA